MKRNSIRHRLLASTMVGGATLFAMTAVSAATLLAPTAAIAQDYTSGVLSGAVSDEAGAPVAGASVTVTSGQGTVRNATTDANGSFRMPALPVGGYTIRIEQSGFAAITQRAAVAPGGASYAFTLTPAGADGATDLGDVVVTARRVQDFTATDTGLSVDVQDFAERVPVGRSINSITLFTPGASAPDPSINNSSRRNQSLVSLSGSSAAESAYYINGMNVTDQRSFLGYAELPFDFVQTIDTKTGGYSAEYGRGTGGVVNIITRSGTNEWTGGISTFWSPDSLRSERGVTHNSGGNNSAGTTVYNQYAKSDLTDYTAFIGGPLWRDHIFFFGAYNVRDVEQEGARTQGNTYFRGSATAPPSITPSTQMSQSVSSYDDPRWAMKLDFVINPNHRIEATYINDETTTVTRSRTFNAATGEQTGITAPTYIDAGGTTEIYKYTGVFTDWFTASALYGRVENAYFDYGDEVGNPGIYDTVQRRYVTSGRQLGTFNLDGYDVRENYRLDLDFYFSLLGKHHVRVGYDREDLETFANSALNGGAYYNAYADEMEVITFTNFGTFNAEQTALYIQDQWEITPNLSVQVGLRNDKYDYQNVEGESYISIDDQWAPRLGFNWDPFGNGVDRIYGSLSDYYLPIATNTSIRASSGERFTYEYFELDRDADGNVVVGADGRPVLGARTDIFYLSPPGIPDPRSVVERDLDPMFEREFVLGYERRFTEGMFTDWSVGFRYVRRNLESTFEDTAIGDAVWRYCQRTGQMSVCNPGGASITDFSSAFPYVLLNPGNEAVVYLDLQGDARADLSGNPNPDYNPQTFTLTAEDLALPEAKRNYNAFEFTFERPFDGTWSLGGSYTLAQSTGNYEGAVKSDIGQTDTSITQDFDHAANAIGANGYLPNHHRHTLKLYGNYSPFERLNIGGSVVGQSGRKYGCLGRVPTSIDPLAPQTGTPSGWFCPLGLNNETVATPRGSQGETPFTWQVDARLDYRVFETENRGNLTASVEVFNLFDNDAVIRVVEQGFIRNDASTTAGPTNYAARSPFYGMARNYQSPRSVRIGLKYTF